MSVEIKRYIIGYLEGCDPDNIPELADDIMNMLRVVCTNEDTYHLFVGYLNDLRLEMADNETGDPKPT